MSEITKFINSFFKEAVKSEVDSVRSRIVLSDRQEKVFEMYYIKGQPIGYIADTLCVCPMVINNELKAIRKKLMKIL